MMPRENIAANSLSRLRISKEEGILLLAWSLINFFLLLHRGIYLEGESAKYIRQAHLLLDTGHLESPNFRLYFVQIALLAACIKLHWSFYVVVAIQLLVNLIATTFFFRTIARFSQNRSTALIGALLLVLAYPYQEFNTFLYTESLFFSLTLILSCYTIRIESLTAGKLITEALLLTLVSVTRPTGLLFLPPAFLYLCLVFFRNKTSPGKTALLATLTVVFLFLLNKILGAGGELDLMLPFRNEQIICGVPTAPGLLPIKTADDSNSLYGLLYYVLHNPTQFFRLAAWKTVAFFGLFRSYYSTGHNLYLLLLFQAIHLAALASIGYWIKHHRFAGLYLLTIIALTWITVMLACDDWHNRFYLDIVPFLILLGMPAIQRLFIRTNTRSKPT